MNRLYLIRHALAELRGPAYPDDRLRPLQPKGHKQARRLANTLAKLSIGFDRVYTSPYTRAQQTAAALQGLLVKGRNIETLALLAGDNYQALWHFVSELEDTHVALVGHEPWLAEFLSTLLSGKPGLGIRFKKASLAVLECDGTVTLRELITPRFVTDS